MTNVTLLPESSMQRALSGNGPKDESK